MNEYRQIYSSKFRLDLFRSKRDLTSVVSLCHVQGGNFHLNKCNLGVNRRSERCKLRLTLMEKNYKRSVKEGVKINFLQQKNVKENSEQSAIVLLRNESVKTKKHKTLCQNRKQETIEWFTNENAHVLTS